MPGAANVTERPPTDWNAIRWYHANKVVKNLRHRIFRASREGDLKKVRSLEKLMLRSYSNIVVSTRRVTQVNEGRNTPGVDKLVVKTPEARGRLVDHLTTFQPRKAKPARRVYIPKASGKLRPLGIPTIADRAVQAMVKNALEPFWEARVEGSSYGFRPGRSQQDAIQKIYQLSRPNGRKKWVLDADIKGAFDNISHDFLLETIGGFPARELIKQWLKAGYVDKDVFHDTEKGTPQGGVISPLLANIALHGMEEALGVIHHHRKGRQGEIRGPRAVVRYADDFVVYCESEEDARKVRDEILPPWLERRGLTLSAEKTRIVHLTEGFDFLGFNIRLYHAPKTAKSGFKLLTKPTDESVKKFRAKIRGEWYRLRGKNVREVIDRLNPILRGWANYFRTGVSSEVFNALDRWMLKRELRWAKYTHSKKPAWWRWQKYFGDFNSRRKDYGTFGDKQTKKYVYKLAWTHIKRHDMVFGTASPDDPDLKWYWRERTGKHSPHLPRDRYRLIVNQDYKCPVCGEYLLNGEQLERHRVEPERGYVEDNIQLLHLYCHQQVTAEQQRSKRLHK